MGASLKLIKLSHPKSQIAEIKQKIDWYELNPDPYKLMEIRRDLNFLADFIERYLAQEIEASVVINSQLQTSSYSFAHQQTTSESIAA